MTRVTDFFSISQPLTYSHFSFFTFRPLFTWPCLSLSLSLSPSLFLLCVSGPFLCLSVSRFLFLFLFLLLLLIPIPPRASPQMWEMCNPCSSFSLLSFHWPLAPPSLSFSFFSPPKAGDLLIERSEMFYFTFLLHLHHTLFPFLSLHFLHFIEGLLFRQPEIVHSAGYFLVCDVSSLAFSLFFTFWCEFDPTFFPCLQQWSSFLFDFANGLLYSFYVSGEREKKRREGERE